VSNIRARNRGTNGMVMFLFYLRRFRMEGVLEQKLDLDMSFAAGALTELKKRNKMHPNLLGSYLNASQKADGNGYRAG
jgi:hypothetical protein